MKNKTQEELLLTYEDWNNINKKAGVDVIDIVINLDGKYTPVQQADLIVERCNLTAQAQLFKVLKAGYVSPQEQIDANAQLEQWHEQYEAKIEEAVKAEREKILNFIDWLDNGTRSSESWRTEIRKVGQALKALHESQILFAKSQEIA